MNRSIHMRRSSSNLVAHNAADHCHPTRSEYCRTAQNNGCDSASLLLIKDSNDNLVINNSLTDGGDGIFSAAMGPADPSCPPSPTPCPDCCHWGTDRNVYERNDVRFARALCMESTFAFDNVFKSNRATNCSIAGAWLGYSVNASLIDNDLSDSPTGVRSRCLTAPPPLAVSAGCCSGSNGCGNDTRALFFTDIVSC